MNDKIKAALAEAIDAAMDDVHDIDVTHADYARAGAAAVMALVGPKQLEWEYPSDGSAHDVDCRYEVALDGKYWRLVKGVTGGGAYIGHFPDRAAAQAAAQSHRDAAWWGQSVLGDMIGGE
jgi:hypothetical protein